MAFSPQRFSNHFSQTAHRLSSNGSDVWDISNRAAALERAGESVIRLCVGDPDFDTPTPIHAAVGQSLRRGRTHYSPSQGEAELRRAIATLETQTSHHTCQPEEVVVFPGATNALYSVLSCLLDPHDELLVPDPHYIGYCGLLAVIGCRVTPVPLQVGNNFAFDIDGIKAAISPDTRAVLINTPGNPAGNMISQDHLAELADYLRQRNIWLVCDEVYSMITFDRRHVSLRASARQLENVVMIDGLSKSHAMSGWRIGWALAPESLVPHLSNFTAATIFGCPQFIQDAAAFALQHDEYYVAQMREEYRRRRDLVVERIAKIDGLHCQPPAAGMFVMVNVRALGVCGRVFAGALLEHQKVSTLPGDGFGNTTKDFVRITLAQPREQLEEALQRIGQFVKNHYLFPPESQQTSARHKRQ